jgi:hypothetical protein
LSVCESRFLTRNRVTKVADLRCVGNGPRDADQLNRNPDKSSHILQTIVYHPLRQIVMRRSPLISSGGLENGLPWSEI